MPRQDFRTAAC